jgi:hypothetical protein
MIDRLMRIALRPPMTPQQRSRRLLFWTGITLLGVLIWSLADLIPHSAR